MREYFFTFSFFLKFFIGVTKHTVLDTQCFDSICLCDFFFIVTCFLLGYVCFGTDLGFIHTA